MHPIICSWPAEESAFFIAISSEERKKLKKCMFSQLVIIKIDFSFMTFYVFFSNYVERLASFDISKQILLLWEMKKFRKKAPWIF